MAERVNFGIMNEHYKGNIILQTIEHFGLNFNRGNVVKYVCRAGSKPNNPELQELIKARDYLQREIDRLQGTLDSLHL